MGKYIPPEKMTVEQIQDNIDERFRAWNQIAQNGCSDPGWPDGVNMNLVRNHIITTAYCMSGRQHRCKSACLTPLPVPKNVPSRRKCRITTW